MSRRAFRTSVEEPRPASAWAMVGVAAATLWITEQLAVWAIIVQIAAITLSLWRRRAPFAWQSSPIALNLGMMGVTGATIHVALAGGPATLGLAHFAALTQGLQLLDARPRRTEFLLVALALFQVILASNLTDSVFFPPLLAVFLFATVWTLLVHTLRSEAAEADERQSARSALTPGLLRVTLIASLASLVLALVLFVLLPRLHSSIVQGSPVVPGFATAGFSDRVSLGELGRIRQDSTVVLRVETLEGRPPPPEAAYWRGLAFDHFDGESWSITPTQRSAVAGSPETGIWLGGPDADAGLVQRIVREPVAGGVLFRVGSPRELQGTVRRIERDVNGGLYAAGQSTDRLRYTVSSAVGQWSDRRLRDDTARPPQADGDRYLQLPPLPDAVAELAREITGTADSDADRVRALERHLLRNGTYSDTPPAVEEGSQQSALEAFLFDSMAAHCEYYASALVVLARSIGLPARLVNGFAGGRENRIGDFVELSRSHAHAWVEVHFEEAGWVRYDATPPSLRQRAEEALSLDERIRQLASAMELWWFQRVVGFDRSDQMNALKKAWLAWRGERDSPGRPEFRSKRERSAGGVWALGAERWRQAALAFALAAALGVWSWRHRSTRSSRVPRYYVRGLKMLERRGLFRDPSTAARDFAREAASELPGEAGRAFARLTECYLAERFGARDAPEADLLLRELRSALPGWALAARSR